MFSEQSRQSVVVLTGKPINPNSGRIQPEQLKLDGISAVRLLSRPYPSCFYLPRHTRTPGVEISNITL